jgi:hypothetical protein
LPNGSRKPTSVPYGLLDRPLRELDAFGDERLIGLSAVFGREPKRETGCALRDELANLLSRARIHRGRPGFFEQDVASRLPRNTDGQPAHEPEVLIGTDFEAQLADVKVQRFVLVEDEDVRDGDGVQHVSDSLRIWSHSSAPAMPALLQNCSVASMP